jgi:hypothetical protein
VLVESLMSLLDPALIVVIVIALFMPMVSMISALS